MPDSEALSKPQAVRAFAPWTDRRAARPSRATAPPATAARLDRTIAIAVFTAGVAWASLYLWQGRHLLGVDRWEEVEIGAHLAAGHGFASPFDATAAAPPTSWSPPVYPLMVAAAMRLFGTTSDAWAGALKLLNAGLYGVVAAGLFLIGRRAFGRAAGLWAAALFLAHPLFLRWVNVLWDTYVALALFVVLLAIAGRCRGRTGRPTFAKLAVFGAGAGALLLTNASYALAVPVIAWVATARRGDGRGRALGLLAIVLGVTAVLAPWTLRNAATFHRLTLVRGGLAFELWYGNRPETTGWFDSQSFDQHPGHSRAERRQLLAGGEPGYFDECGRRFRQGVAADPAAFAWRCAHRAAYLVLSDPDAPSLHPFMPGVRWRGYVIDRVAVNALFALLALGGTWAAWRLGFGASWLALAALLVALPFVPTSVWDRQTLPMRIALVPAAGFLVYALAHRVRRGGWPARAGTLATEPERTSP